MGVFTTGDFQGVEVTRQGIRTTLPNGHFSFAGLAP
jgi:hypothetical protein